jgi:hypothetical protein
MSGIRFPEKFPYEEKFSPETIANDKKMWTEFYGTCLKAVDNLAEHFRLLQGREGEWRRPDLFSEMPEAPLAVLYPEKHRVSEIVWNGYVPLQTYLFPSADPEIIGDSNAPEHYYVHDFALAKLNRDSQRGDVMLKAYSRFLKNRGCSAKEILDKLNALESMREYQLVDAVAKAAAEETIASFFMKEYSRMFLELYRQRREDLARIEWQYCFDIFYRTQEPPFELFKEMRLQCDDVYIIFDLAKTAPEDIIMWKVPALIRLAEFYAYHNNINFSSDREINVFWRKYSGFDLRTLEALPSIACLGDKDPRLTLYFLRFLSHIYRYFFGYGEVGGVLCSVLMDLPENEVSLSPEEFLQKENSYPKENFSKFVIEKCRPAYYTELEVYRFLKKRYPELPDTVIFFKPLPDFGISENFGLLELYDGEEDTLYLAGVMPAEDYHQFRRDLARELPDCLEWNSESLERTLFYTFFLGRHLLFFYEIKDEGFVFKKAEMGRSFVGT